LLHITRFSLANNKRVDAAIDMTNRIDNRMKNIYRSILFTICFLSAAAGINSAIAQDAKGDSVITVLDPRSSDGIFSTHASYTFTVKSTFKNPEAGKLSYLVTTEAGKKVKADSIHIKIAPKGSGSYDFEIPAMKPGFYKISFMINVTDYDDTTRKAFGIRPGEIRSAHQKPADFDKFWLDTKQQLAKVKPEYKITELKKLEKNDHKVFMVEMKSYGNVTIRGYLTEPPKKSKSKTFPVLLGLPGYQVALYPIIGMDPDLAVFTLDVRGQGLSKDQINVRSQDFILLNLEDKDRYVMRGVIMDCIRSVDFICSRPELRHNQILVSGGSMGGYLTIALAGLDKRVTICSVQNPIMSDIYNLDGEVEWPINNMKQYVAIRPGLSFSKILSNLQYYDTKNFATTIKCPVLLGIGLLDPYVPPNNAYAVYNNIPGEKKIMVYKDLAHEVAFKFKAYESRWMNDTFGLF
jgi:cephalosporin-C deacetylase